MANKHIQEKQKAFGGGSWEGWPGRSHLAQTPVKVGSSLPQPFIQPAFGCLQEWRLYHVSRAPFPSPVPYRHGEKPISSLFPSPDSTTLVFPAFSQTPHPLSPSPLDCSQPVHLCIQNNLYSKICEAPKLDTGHQMEGMKMGQREEAPDSFGKDRERPL